MPPVESGEFSGFDKVEVEGEKDVISERYVLGDADGGEGGGVELRAALRGGSARVDGMAGVEELEDGGSVVPGGGGVK